MNMAFRNPALQRLCKLTNAEELPQWRQVLVRAGDCWDGDGARGQEVWFPEQGLWVLEQQAGPSHVEVALLACDGGLVMGAHTGMRLRALLDGQGVGVPHAWLMSRCPDLLLQLQQQLMQRMARWAYCTRHHGMAQRLASSLLWMHQSCDGLAWPVRDWPGAHPLSSAQLQLAIEDLQRAGALSLQGARVQVCDPQVLHRLGCGCHI